MFGLLGEKKELTSIEEHWKKAKNVFNSTCKVTPGESNRKHEEWISKAQVDNINKRIKEKAQVN